MNELDSLQRALQSGDKVIAMRAFTAVAAETLRRDFVAFCKAAWAQIAPQKLVWGWHLDALCEHLVYMTQGEIRFLMVMLPPRSTKSLICSVMWPVFHWLYFVRTQFLCASVDDRLSLDFSRLSRRIIESQWFQNLYGDEFYLLDDENQGRQYRNDKGGQRVAVSVQGRVIGAGGDIQICDDPNSVKQIESDAVRHATLAWHDNEWRSRLNNPKKSQKLYVAQRTHDADVLGHVLAQEKKRWVVLCLPLEYDPKRRCITFLNDGTGVKEDAKPIFMDPRKKEGEMLDPARFDAATAQIEKDIMSPRAWNAQYQQQPEGAGGLILKRHWWRPWVWGAWHKEMAGKEMPLPEFFEIIQVYDTAFEEDEEADFSARTSWGIFNHEEMIEDKKTGHWRASGQKRTCAMLLDSMKEKLTYPDLRDEMIRSDQEMAPTVILIEKKSSGHSLLQELRKMNLPVKAYGLAGSSGRGRGQGDLIARAHESSLMLAKGCIWFCPRQWAYNVIDEAAAFPSADHDDVVSTLTMAWQYLRRYYDLTLPDEDTNNGFEVNPFTWQKARRYA